MSPSSRKIKSVVTAKAKGADKVLISVGKKEATISGEDAIRLAQDLMCAGEKVLKRAGKWKPG